jgi:hypothetical protein
MVEDDDDLYINASNRKGKDIKFRRAQSKLDTMPSMDVFSKIMEQTIPMTVMEVLKNHKGVETQLRDYMKRHNIPAEPMMINILKDAYANRTLDLDE